MAYIVSSTNINNFIAWSRKHGINLPKKKRMVKKLKVLDLKNCSLSDVDCSLCSLKQLEILYLSNNNLTIIPNFIDKLSNLVLLDVSDNLIESIPSEIYALNNLTILEVANNKIEKMPDFFEKSNIELVFVGGNPGFERDTLLKRGDM
jgi:Leucine-rich repeat (LRR) protein